MTVPRAPIALVFALATACGLGVSGTASETDVSVDGGDAAPIGSAEPSPGEGPDASPADAAGGASPIVHVGTTTGQSSNAVAIVGVDVPSGGDFYVAAIATKPHVRVTYVSGGPGNWQLASFQCGEDNQTGVEVWFATKTNTPALATATVGLEKTAESIVMAVSAYEGARAIGNLVSANSNGLTGSCVDGGEGTSTFSLGVVPQPGGSMYGAIAIRNRTVTPDEGTVELAKVGVGEGGAAAGLAILGSTTSVLSGRLNAATGWALIGGVLLP